MYFNIFASDLTLTLSYDGLLCVGQAVRPGGSECSGSVGDPFCGYGPGRRSWL